MSPEHEISPSAPQLAFLPPRSFRSESRKQLLTMKPELLTGRVCVSGEGVARGGGGGPSEDSGGTGRFSGASEQKTAGLQGVLRHRICEALQTSVTSPNGFRTELYRRSCVRIETVLDPEKEKRSSDQTFFGRKNLRMLVPHVQTSMVVFHTDLH